MFFARKLKHCLPSLNRAFLLLSSLSLYVLNLWRPISFLVHRRCPSDMRCNNVSVARYIYNLIMSFPLGVCIVPDISSVAVQKFLP